MDVLEAEATAYAVALGERLRKVRTQQDRSLNDVERSSRGEFKASVLGAYERGERAISVARLRTLADFYRIPLSELMPQRTSMTVTPPVAVFHPAGVRIDLSRLTTEHYDDADTVGRFVNNIRTRRGDYNGRIITIRRDDLRALAAVLDLAPAELRGRLAHAGIVPAIDS